MLQAIAKARQAPQQGEVPVGALIVDPAGTLLAAEHNQPITLSDPSAGAVESCFNGLDLPFHNHRVWHMGGIAAPECASLLQNFFQKSR